MSVNTGNEKEITQVDALLDAIADLEVKKDEVERQCKLEEERKRKLENVSLVRTLTGHSAGFIPFAISPDGQTLVTFSDDNTIEIWNLRTGELLRTLTRHSDTVLKIAISPDGQTFISISCDNGGATTLKIWNLRTGELLRTLTGHSRRVTAIAISPDGQTLVSSSYVNSSYNNTLKITIKIWDLRTGELLRTLTGHSDTVLSIAISTDGQTLVSSSCDNTIKIWNLRTEELLRTLNEGLEEVNAVAISPDGQTLVSSNYDGSINIWQVL